MANNRKYQPLVLHKDNPFKEQIERRITETTDSDKGIILNEEVVIARRRQYIKGAHWVKLTQDKEMLGDLSPWACKILVYIALNMEMNQEKMKLACKDIGMDRRKYDKTMLELLLKRVIVKADKREWYWINVGLLLLGNVNKHGENGA